MELETLIKVGDGSWPGPVLWVHWPRSASDPTAAFTLLCRSSDLHLNGETSVTHVLTLTSWGRKLLCALRSAVQHFLTGGNGKALCSGGELLHKCCQFTTLPRLPSSATWQVHIPFPCSFQSCYRLILQWEVNTFSCCIQHLVMLCHLSNLSRVHPLPPRSLMKLHVLWKLNSCACSSDKKQHSQETFCTLQFYLSCEAPPQ